MGLDYHFYCEKRTDEGWVDLPADEGTAHEPRAFTWMDDKDVVRELFWKVGEAEPLVAMRRDLPADITSTLLFRRCGEAAFAEWYHSWLPFEELLLDLWDETFLLVSKGITPKYARLFGDGRQPFPRELLLAAGLALSDVEGLGNTSYYVKDAKIVREPVNWNLGRNRVELEKTYPESLLWVTWQLSVSQALGAQRTKAFRQQRNYGGDEEMRIICLFS